MALPPYKYTILFFFVSTALSLRSQISVEGTAGLTRNGFFHFDKVTQTTEVDEKIGHFFSLGFKHNLQKRTFARYGLSFEQFRGKYTTENINGRSSFGRKLEMNVSYLGLRVGVEQRFIEKKRFTFSVIMNFNTGMQLNNKTSGTSYEFVPMKIYGPNEEEFTIFIRQDSEYNDERFDEIRSFYFGCDVGVMFEYSISERLSFQFVTGYSVTFIPFFIDSPSNLWRNSIRIGTGAAYKFLR
jgi:hypothetical protein